MLSVVAVDVTAGAWGWSLEALELHVEGGRVRPSHGKGRYGVVSSKAPYIVAICVLQIRLPHHTIGRRHPLRSPPNAVSVEEQDDGHCGSEHSVMAKDVSICSSSFSRSCWMGGGRQEPHDQDWSRHGEYFRWGLQLDDRRVRWVSIADGLNQWFAVADDDSWVPWWNWGWPLDGLLEGGHLFLEGATMGARGSMPLVDEVILAEDYQAGIVVLDCISNRAIGEDLEVLRGSEGKGLKRKVSLLGWRHSLVNWCDYCRDGGRLVPWKNWKLLTGGEELELKPGDWVRADLDSEIECCAGFPSSGAVCMRWWGLDDDRRQVEDWPSRQLFCVRWFGNALK